MQTKKHLSTEGDGPFPDWTLEELEECILVEETGTDLKAEALTELWTRHVQFSVRREQFMMFTQFALVVYVGLALWWWGESPWWCRLLVTFGALFWHMLSRYLMGFIYLKGDERVKKD